MTFLFRLLLNFSATSLLLIIFLIHTKHTLAYFFPNHLYLSKLPDCISYFLYLTVPVLLTWLSIFLSSCLSKDNFDKGHIVSIQNANNSFLPSYLGYFFLALTLDGWEIFWFVYGIIFVFTFLSQTLYFNPLFLLFKFNFYNITTKNGAKVFLITRNSYKIPHNIFITTAYRINNYTYFER